MATASRERWDPPWLLPDPAPAPGKRQGSCSPLSLLCTYPGPQNPWGGVCLLHMPAGVQSSSSGVFTAANIPSRKGLVKHCAKAQDSSRPVPATFISVPEERTFRFISSLLFPLPRSHLPTTPPLIYQGQGPRSTANLYKSEIKPILRGRGGADLLLIHTSLHALQPA